MRSFLTLLCFAVSTLPAATITINSPTLEYLAGTTLADLSGLTLGNAVSSFSVGGVTITPTPTLSVGTIGSLDLGIWMNTTGATIETPGPSRAIYSVTDPTISLVLSQITKTFGFEIAPYSDVSQDFTVTYFNGATQIGQISQTVTTDLVAGDFVLQAAVVGLSSTLGFDRVTITTSGAGAVLAQWRLSLNSLPSASDPINAPEPSKLIPVGGVILAIVSARKRNRAC